MYMWHLARRWSRGGCVSSQVAEGVATASALTKVVDARVKGFRKDLKYPIIYGVNNILEGRISPREG